MQIINLPTHPVAVYQKGDLNAKKLALVLPGKLDTKDYAHMRAHVDGLAQMGYLALSFDLPGTWESPGDISLYSFKNYFTAIHELIAHFGNRPTITIGHSRGGGMAMLAGVQLPQVTAFVSIMGSDYPSEIWTTFNTKASRRDIPYTTPVEYREFVTHGYFLHPKEVVDMLLNFAQCTKPKLFILGTQDQIVLPEDVISCYKKFGEPKKLIKLEMGHDYRHNAKEVTEVQQVIETFLTNI